MLKKVNRILKKKEFDNVFQNGKSAYFKILGIKAVKNGKPESRFGVIISTKVSKKATNRNRIKRQIREIIRKNLDKIEKGYDFIIIVLPQIKEADFTLIKEILISTMLRLRLIKK